MQCLPVSVLDLVCFVGCCCWGFIKAEFVALCGFKLKHSNEDRTPASGGDVAQCHPSDVLPRTYDCTTSQWHVVYRHADHPACLHACPPGCLSCHAMPSCTMPCHPMNTLPLLCYAMLQYVVPRQEAARVWRSAHRQHSPRQLPGSHPQLGPTAGRFNARWNTSARTAFFYTNLEGMAPRLEAE